MIELLNKKEEEKLSIIKDPFSKDCIVAFDLNMMTSFFSGKKLFYGSVSFKNGDTEGKHKTKDHDNFESLYLEMKQIIESVK